MPPKNTRQGNKKRNHWNKHKKKKPKSKPKAKHHKKDNADLTELANIFKSIKSNKRSNKSRNKSRNKSKKEPNNKPLKKSLNELSKAKPKPKPIPFISRKQQFRLETKEKSHKQLKSLPNNLLIPKCSLCRTKMVIKRGDQCYEGFNSVSCDYCGREDIHGQVWHCEKCEHSNNKHMNGFNLCKTCGYLISHKRQNEIRRVAPPKDDMSLLFNKPIRNASQTLDGFTIYRESDIKKTLKIGLGGQTKMCPFDCQCCF